MVEILDALKIMFVSALPVVELRGGIPMGALMELPALATFVLCVIGNMLPVPFIILLWRWVVNLFKKGKIRDLFDRLEAKAASKKEVIEKYEIWGLYVFVAIPLPGTGAWTGALIAATLGIPLRKAIMPIFLGVVTAGAIMTVVAYGGTAMLASIFQ